jgi:hypothetical protein
MTMTPPDAQGPDDLSEEERELLPDGDQAPDSGDVPSAEVDDDNVPHPPSEQGR